MIDHDVTLLRELLARRDQPTSTARIARALGRSSRSVSNDLKRLATEGFEFATEARRGTRLIALPSHAHAALILAHLGRSKLRQLVCLETTDSTNSEAERRLAAGDATPLVIIARRQTHGRGRRGRIWQSTQAGNLYITFAFRPHATSARLQDFTLWLGVSLCELVEKFCRLSPGLKWPNDLHLGGRKAGGMLTEARIDSDQVRDLVFGLGLNINGQSDDLPPEVRRLATSLAEAKGEPIDFNKFTAALIGRILLACQQFEDGSYRARFRTLWERYDLLRDRPVSVIQGTRTVLGTATGIDEEGSLLVQTDSGRVERFRAGEVTLGKGTA